MWAVLAADNRDPFRTGEMGPANRTAQIDAHRLASTNVRRSAVALDRKRTIFGAVSRARDKRLAVGYITAERLGDFVDRGKVTCWHGNGGERAGRSPGRSRSRLLS